MEIDINLRKIVLAKKILDLKDEFLLENIEKYFKKNTYEKEFSAMSLEEFYARIAQSEKDFAEGRYVNSAELLKEFK